MKFASIAAAVLLAAMPLTAGSIAVAKHAAIATASPSATRIGLETMRRGGNAIDAAAAVAIALGSSSGGFLVYYDAATQSVWTLDFFASPTAAGLAAMQDRFGTAQPKEHLAKNVVEKGEKPVWRAPVRVTYREYDIYTLPPPSSAGLMIGEELNILSGFDVKNAEAARRIHLLAEAARRAAIDRDRFISDPSTMRTPYRDVLSVERANRWRASIDPLRATPTISLGEQAKSAMTPGAPTTHFSVIDPKGNVAAVTLSLESPPPARTRIFSSAAPAIVLRRGAPYLVLGTSGGVEMPNLVLHAFLDVAIGGKSLADAVAAPRFDQQATPDDMTYEVFKIAPETAAKLHAMGHGLREITELGDMQALMIEPQRITAVSDPRHGGAAGGY